MFPIEPIPFSTIMILCTVLLLVWGASFRRPLPDWWPSTAIAIVSLPWVWHIVAWLGQRHEALPQGAWMWFGLPAFCGLTYTCYSRLSTLAENTADPHEFLSSVTLASVAVGGGVFWLTDYAFYDRLLALLGVVTVLAIWLVSFLRDIVHAD